MRSFIKKHFCVFLCLCILFPILSIPSFAVGDDLDNYVYIENQTFDSVSEIEVPVYVHNNTGFVGFWLEFEYDTEAMTPVSVAKGGVLRLYDNAIFENSIGGSVQDRLIITWANGENAVEDGELFVITFSVKPSANGNYPIRISFN